MSAPRSDRALRRVVAQLAVAKEEDVQAILATLEEPQRERVEALLASYTGETPRLAKPPVLPVPPLQGLSPWLAARLERAGETVARPTASDDGALYSLHIGMAFQMTSVALGGLAAAAADVRADSPFAMPVSTRQADRSTWIARLTERLVGGGAL